MNKRNFIKSITGIAAAACFGCSFSGCTDKSRNAEIGGENSDLLKKFEAIEFPLSYHCNFCCAYCSHYSTIAPEYLLPLDVFKRDIKRMSKILNGKINEVRLLGGEPLLNPNIEEMMKLSAEYFPDAVKRIGSNGLLIKDMPESFWKTLKETGFKIKVSAYHKYPDYYNLIQYDKIKNEHGEDIKFKEGVNSFNLTNLDNNPKPEDDYNFALCEKKYVCTQIDSGKLSMCAPMAYVKFFNAKFKDYAVKIPDNHFLDIYKISSLEEILNYFKEPKEFCRYCHMGHNQEYRPWTITKRDVSEWYRV